MQNRTIGPVRGSTADIICRTRSNRFELVWTFPKCWKDCTVNIRTYTFFQVLVTAYTYSTTYSYHCAPYGSKVNMTGDIPIRRVLTTAWLAKKVGTKTPKSIVSISTNLKTFQVRKFNLRTKLRHLYKNGRTVIWLRPKSTVMGPVLWVCQHVMKLVDLHQGVD